MNIFGLFRRPRRNDPCFGELTFRSGKWSGNLSLPELFDRSFRLEIEAGLGADLTPFRNIYGQICEKSDIVKAEIEAEAFETYRLYMEEDRRSGIFRDQDFVMHLRVTSASDVWKVLQPLDLHFTPGEADFNWVLSMDVDWPNPHCFVAYFRDLKLDVLTIEG